jgi:hypothetical protein
MIRPRTQGGAHFLLLSVLLLAAGCRQPLPHAARTAGELGREVVAALERRDVARLRQLAVNDVEFREVVWPELPAARPERNLPVEYVWNDLRTKSEAGLRRLLAEYGGQRLEFVRLAFDGETTQHRTYLVRRNAITVIRGEDGGERQLRLFGSTIERHGGFKVFSYVVD